MGHRCCCGSTCIFAQDNFSRTDGTDITTGSSCGWTESTGNWSIASNTLTVASANAKATCGTTDTAHMYVESKVKSSAVGDKLQVYTGNKNYVAELTLGSPGKLRIMVAGAVYRECDFTAAVNTFYTLKLCQASFLNAYPVGFYTPDSGLYGAALTASIDGVMILSAIELSTYSGATTVGVGTGGTLTGTAVFDDFIAGDTYPDDSDCPNCAGECCWPVGETLPDQVKLTIQNMADTGGGCTAGNCANLNGEYFLDKVANNQDCFDSFDGAHATCACYSLDISVVCDGAVTWSKIWLMVDNYFGANQGCTIFAIVENAAATQRIIFYKSFGTIGPSAFNAAQIAGGENGAQITLVNTFGLGSSGKCDYTTADMLAEAV